MAREKSSGDAYSNPQGAWGAWGARSPERSPGCLGRLGCKGRSGEASSIRSQWTYDFLPKVATSEAFQNGGSKALMFYSISLAFRLLMTKQTEETP
jgi:hypothetical protein